ncbi:MAG: hypothetical protein V1858_04635 [Candidatus Gottesmanbacteria bacterium]
MIPLSENERQALIKEGAIKVEILWQSERLETLEQKIEAIKTLRTELLKYRSEEDADKAYDHEKKHAESHRGPAMLLIRRECSKLLIIDDIFAEYKPLNPEELSPDDWIDLATAPGEDISVRDYLIASYNKRQKQLDIKDSH